MALPHARPLDVIDVAPQGERLHGQPSTSLIKTDRLQLLHLVLAAHQDLPRHHVDDECTIHCLEGEVDVKMGAGVRQLRPGQVIVVPAKEPHSVKARSESALLVTLLLHGGDAGNQGGGGRRYVPGKETPIRP
ncbi:MAG: cupin domain-containing protein [Burkholderiales bacterium]|nr:cupin domain-containing protein [Burkholderiales bacterium]